MLCKYSLHAQKLSAQLFFLRRQKLADLQARDGALKLSHFRRVRQLGSGDVGLVDLVQLQGDPNARYAMKTLEKREMFERNKVQTHPPPSESGTAHICVIDRAVGMASHISK